MDQSLNKELNQNGDSKRRLSLKSPHVVKVILNFPRKPQTTRVAVESIGFATSPVLRVLSMGSYLNMQQPSLQPV